MKPIYDEYGVVHYELPTLDDTLEGLKRAMRRMDKELVRPRMVRRVK
jgi:hypothetical protein